MFIEIPPQLNWVVYITVGEKWPDGDEEAMLRLSEAWAGLAADLAGLGNEIDEASKAVQRAGSGAAFDAAQEYFGAITHPETGVAVLRKAALDYATLCRDAGLKLQYAKLMILTMAAWLMVQLAKLAWLAFVTSGVSWTAAPAVTKAAQVTTEALLKKIALTIVSGSLFMTSLDVIVQTIQFLKKDRRGVGDWDLRSTLTMAGIGALGGLSGLGLRGMARLLAPNLGETWLGKSLLEGLSEAIPEGIIEGGPKDGFIGGFVSGSVTEGSADYWTDKLGQRKRLMDALGIPSPKLEALRNLFNFKLPPLPDFGELAAGQAKPPPPATPPATPPAAPAPPPYSPTSPDQQPQDLPPPYEGSSPLPAPAPAQYGLPVGYALTPADVAAVQNIQELTSAGAAPGLPTDGQLRKLAQEIGLHNQSQPEDRLKQLFRSTPNDYGTLLHLTKVARDIYGGAVTVAELTNVRRLVDVARWDPADVHIQRPEDVTTAHLRNYVGRLANVLPGQIANPDLAHVVDQIGEYKAHTERVVTRERLAALVAADPWFHPQLAGPLGLTVLETTPEFAWLREVNPLRDSVPGPDLDPQALWTNCVLAAIATDMTLGEHAAGLTDGWYQAGAAGPRWATDLERYACQAPTSATRHQIEDRLLAAGPSARGIVTFTTKRGDDHVLNAVNHKGAVVFLDGQLGQRVDLPPDARGLKFLPMTPAAGGLTLEQRTTLDRQNLVAVVEFDDRGGRRMTTRPQAAPAPSPGETVPLLAGSKPGLDRLLALAGAAALEDLAGYVADAPVQAGDDADAHRERHLALLVEIAAALNADATFADLLLAYRQRMAQPVADWLDSGELAEHLEQLEALGGAGVRATRQAQIDRLRDDLARATQQTEPTQHSALLAAIRTARAQVDQLSADLPAEIDALRADRGRRALEDQIGPAANRLEAALTALTLAGFADAAAGIRAEHEELRQALTGDELVEHIPGLRQAYAELAGRADRLAGAVTEHAATLAALGPLDAAADQIGAYDLGGEIDLERLVHLVRLNGQLDPGPEGALDRDALIRRLAGLAALANLIRDDERDAAHRDRLARELRREDLDDLVRETQAWDPDHPVTDQDRRDLAAAARRVPANELTPRRLRQVVRLGAADRFTPFGTASSSCSGRTTAARPPRSTRPAAPTRTTSPVGSRPSSARWATTWTSARIRPGCGRSRRSPRSMSGSSRR